MDVFFQFLRSTGIPGMAELVLCPLLGFTLLFFLMLLVLGKRVPPLFFILALIAPIVVAILGIWQGEYVASNVTHASPEVRQTLVAMGIVQEAFTKWGSAWILMGLSGLVVIGGAVVGLRQTPRTLKGPALQAILCLGVVSLVFGGALYSGDGLYGFFIRPPLLLVVGGLVALSASAQGRGSVGTLGGAIAAMAFPFFVASLEGLALVSDQILAFEYAATAPPKSKSLILSEALNMVSSRAIFSLSAVFCAILIAAVGAGRAMTRSFGGVAIGATFLLVFMAPVWLVMGPESTFSMLIEGMNEPIEVKEAQP